MRNIKKTPILKGKKLAGFFNGSLSVNGKYVTLIFKNSTEKSVGFSAKKSIVKNAVMRNYYKRLLRNIYAEIEELADRRCDYFFILSNNGFKNYAELKEDVKNVLFKIHSFDK